MNNNIITAGIFVAMAFAGRLCGRDRADPYAACRSPGSRRRRHRPLRPSGDAGSTDAPVPRG